MKLGKSNPEFKWKYPRPPCFRFCSLTWTSLGWPDSGKGIWEIVGYRDMGKETEHFQLILRMPAPGSHKAGEHMWISRYSYEQGAVKVWRKDLLDPKYCPPTAKESL